MEPANAFIAASLAAMVGFAVVIRAPKSEVPSQPSQIDQVMRLQDELRREGYTVVRGKGHNCKARNLPEDKVAVVCGKNLVNELHTALRAAKQESFLF